MKLDQLVPSLSTRKGAIITLFQGKPVRHPYLALADDVARARALLVRWNVKAGMRVGIFAPNSYAYIVYDLALVDLQRDGYDLARVSDPLYVRDDAAHTYVRLTKDQSD